ncbi:hypothetical protein RKE29_27800 [Streptomyces sp. B1866]|uniref:hypothetical protein n=1 Tax=Streptomyces sp. B1866 TaxID=3075431 RepID=UPI00288E82DB|nr:hypothetical protein [Streptomyces sp. B1866]MDT3400370.1 hypothetical protein [Streptomyces sp. B1866]
MAADRGRGGREPVQRDGPPAPSRGIPDSVLVGAIAFLLGITTLVWSAAGLAAVFSRGGWPDGVRFVRTPLAMRRLVQEPHDLAAAWPETPKEQLSGSGLFWGIFISELMVLFVLSVFVIGTVTRYRLVRAKRRAAREAAREQPAAPAPAETTAGPARPHPGEPETAAPAAWSEPRPGPPGDPYAAARPFSPAGATPPVATAPTPLAPPTPAPAGSAAAPLAAPLPATGFPDAGTPRPRVLYGAARGTAAADAVLDAAGPVLAVTSDPELWAATKDARAKLGPTHVFDPCHLLDIPARLRWNPAAGCESRETAAARAAALLAPVRPVHAMDQPTAQAAETMLRCWLHAAAVDGRSFRHVHRWAHGGAAHEPVRILRTHPKALGGVAGELEATLTAHPERRDVAQELTARALGALSSIHIRDACSPGRAEALALESFIEEGGTLYVVGEPIEDPRTDPGAMPLLTALASSVVGHGRRLAGGSPSGRLDPPLTLVLDDVAAVAPLPDLPGLLAEDAGAVLGMPTLALMRSREQARARWPHDTLTD